MGRFGKIWVGLGRFGGGSVPANLKLDPISWDISGTRCSPNYYYYYYYYCYYYYYLYYYYSYYYYNHHCY
ncbi:hypothetical protein DPMN_134615 [Dreissena polymorpha]|uniref:Uncharacterized protein n=1 Tax=Dreissena polymorpha TaxID=45954 RepID=A0A9D4FXN2_DREPO|nr:hypothetical protein DPMN_134615 [Dreissena polymorpha]